MRLLSLFMLLPLLGVVSSQCTPSTLVEEGIPYDCMMDLSSEVTIHWIREIFGQAQFVATTTSVTGWFSISFPRNLGSMFPAIGVATTGATTTGIFSFSERTAAGITSVSSRLFHNPTTEIANGMRFLRFRINSDFMYSATAVNFAFHSSEMEFPVSKHTSVGSVAVSFVEPRVVVTEPALVPTCTASTLFKTESTTYDCMSALSPDVTLHWDQVEVIQGLPFHLQRAGVAATTTSVNGWFSVSFPEIPGSMVPALGVATTSATDASIYAFHERTAGGIISRQSFTTSTIQSPSTEIVNDMRILRFNVHTAFLIAATPVNFAFHSSEMEFPVSKHTTAGSVIVNFREPPQVLPPTEPVVSPPTEPVVSPPTEPVVSPPTEPVVSPPTEPLVQLPTRDTTCTPSTLVEAGISYDCMMDLSSEVTIHWIREIFGQAQFVATTTSVTGWFSISFPRNLGSMFPAIGVATTGATTTGIFSFSERTAAGITSVSSRLFHNPTTEIANGMRFLRFRINSDFMYSATAVNFAFHSSEMEFPVSKHTSVGSVAVSFVEPRVVVTEPALVPTCTASTLFKTESTTYDCMSALSPDVTLHWDQVEVIQGLPFHLQRAGVAATTTSVNGWFSVSFPEIPGSMVPALGVATTSATDANIYTFHERTAGGIISRQSFTTSTIQSPSTEIVNDMRILRFNVHTAFLIAATPVNFAFHSSEMEFPVSKHTTAGSVIVNFREPPQVLPPTEPVVSPPTEPVVSPPTEPVVSPPTEPLVQLPTRGTTCTPSTLVEAGISYDCMMDLSSEVTIHWIREIFGQAQFVATTTSVTGWFSISFPRNLGSMFPAIGVATTGATTTGIFSFSERTAAGITSVSSRLFHNPTTEIANGMRFLRFRINSDFMYSATAVNFAFHSSEMEFPVSKHTSVGSVAVSFVEPRVVVTEPALVPTCTASTLFKTESTTYDCMSALSPDVTLHWDQVEVIQGLPFHLQRAGVAATTTSVNGWFSVSFPEIPGSMVPALGVATTSATDANIYTFHERTAGGIISRQSFTTSTIQSPSTEIVNDMRILRFNVHTAFLIAATPVNFAFHSSEMEFPVSKHTTAGSVIVNFREPPQVLPPTEPVVSPPTEPVVSPPTEPVVSPPTEPLVQLPTRGTTCTPSTLVEAGISYDCMMDLSSEVTIHWIREIFGQAQFVATTTSVTGWFSISFPRNLGSMFPAIGVATTGATTTGIFSFSERTAAGITSVSSRLFHNPTTEIANGMRFLRFRINSDFMYSATAVNFAFHSSKMGFPVSKHTSVGSVAVYFVEPRVVVTEPALVPTCTASTLFKTESTTYDCMSALSPDVTLHWDQVEVIQGLPFHLQRAGVAATTTYVNGWFSVSFPEIPGSMVPALGVATTSATDANIYTFHERTAGGIISRQSFSTSTIQSPSTEIVNDMRILRFNVHTAFLIAATPVNFAFHSSEMEFPVSKHTTAGSVIVNFREPLQVLPPTEPVVSPPTEPVVSPPTEPVVSPPTEPVVSPPTEPLVQLPTRDTTCTPSTLVEAGISYDCMMDLSSEVTIHWIREIFGQAQFVATTTSVTGWFSISFPRNLGSMFPAIGVATTGATTTGIFSFSERTAAGITSVSSRLFHNPTTEIANGMRFLRFRINSDFMYSATAVNFAFHSSEMEFPVSKHTSVGSVAVYFVEPRVVVTEPALVPTCTASTLFKTESTTYDCMSALSPDVTLHWDQVEVIQGLPFHLQRAGVAATTTSVNGWFSVSFPEIPGSMVPALGVATTSATDANIYTFHERTAGGIISRQSFTTSTIQSPSTEIVNDMRILRFNVHTAFLIAATPVNFAFHSSEMEFPVSKHTTAGSVIVNFREPPQVLPPTEPVVSPPMEPVVSPPTEPVVSPPTEPVVSPPTEPVVSPPTEPVVSPPMEPVVSPPTEPVVSPPTEPVVSPPTEPVVSPPTEPVVSPPTEPVVSPPTEPVVSPPTEPVVSPPTEPVVSPPTEPVVSPPMEPVVSPPTEPVVSPPTEPVVSPPTEPVVSPPTEPVVSPPMEPVVSPPTEPVVSPPTEPVVSPPTEPVVSPPTEPVVSPPTEPVVSPPTEPVVSPPTEPVVSPPTEPVVSPPTEPVVSPPTEPVVSPPTEPVVSPPTEPVVSPPTEPVVSPPTEPVVSPPTEPVVSPPTEPVVSPPTEPVVSPPTEPVVSPPTEPVVSPPTEPVVSPPTEPVVSPPTEPVVSPPTEPVVSPPTEPVVSPPTEPVVSPPTEPVVSPPTEPVVSPPTEPVVSPPTEPVVSPPTEPVVSPPTEPVVSPPTEPVVSPPTEPVVSPPTEPVVSPPTEPVVSPPTEPVVSPPTEPVVSPPTEPVVSPPTEPVVSPPTEPVVSPPTEPVVSPPTEPVVSPPTEPVVSPPTEPVVSPPTEPVVSPPTEPVVSPPTEPVVSPPTEPVVSPPTEPVVSPPTEPVVSPPTEPVVSPPTEPVVSPPTEPVVSPPTEPVVSPPTEPVVSPPTEPEVSPPTEPVVSPPTEPVVSPPTEPVVSPPTEPVVSPPTEPVVSPPTEPVVSPPTEPVVSPPTEPVVSPPTEPEVSPPTEPVVSPPTEPVVSPPTEPVVSPPTEPVVSPPTEPVVSPPTEPVVSPPTEPVVSPPTEPVVSPPTEPVVSPPTEPVVSPPTEPVVSPPTEPVVSPPTEPEVSPPTEPVVSPPTEPVVSPPTEPVVSPPTEPVVSPPTEPVVSPPTEPVVSPPTEPVVSPPTEPVVSPPTEPVVSPPTEPVVSPPTEPVVSPPTEPVVSPPTEPVVSPPTEPVVSPPTEPEVSPPTEPVVSPPTEPVVSPPTEPVVSPPTEPVVSPPTEPVVSPPTEPVVSPPTEPVVSPPTEPVVSPPTEPVVSPPTEPVVSPPTEPVVSPPTEPEVSPPTEPVVSPPTEPVVSPPTEPVVSPPTEPVVSPPTEPVVSPPTEPVVSPPTEPVVSPPTEPVVSPPTEPVVSPPTEPEVSPPTEPVVTPPPEPKVTRPAENSINFEVVAELSDLVTQIDTLVAAASSSLGGNARCDMLCQGRNCLKCDGTAVTQRSVTTLVRGNWKVILIIINNENGSITKEAIDSSLKNVLSNNAVIGYVEGSAAVVVVVTDIPQVVVVNDGFIDAHTHGRIMVAVWAYWVPLSVIIKVLGALVCKREVFGYPIPVLIHMFMMVMAMCFTTVFASFALSDFNNRVDYGHRELGITLLVIGWIQVLSGLVRPGRESQYRKYWGWGHVLFGISVVIIAIAQMASGVENIKRLFPNDSNDVQIVLIVGLVTMGVIYIVGKIYVAVTKEAVISIAENNETKHCEPDYET